MGKLPQRIDLTLDCADAGAVAPFWRLALGYVDQPCVLRPFPKHHVLMADPEGNELCVAHSLPI
jgi:hypothetical protein